MAGSFGQLHGATVAMAATRAAASSRSPRSRLVTATVLGALLAAVVSVAGASTPSGASGAPGALGADGVDPCPGALRVVGEVVEAGGPTMCTHGVDPAVTPQALAAQGGAAPEATSGIQCYTDGTSGARVQLVYAHSSTINRFTTFKRTMKQRAGQIEAIYDASARQTGGRRHVRWATNANCNVQVRSVLVPASAIPVDGFQSLVESLRAQGFNSNDRKYLVWADTGRPTNVNSATCVGLGTLFPDETDNPATNDNNQFGGFTRVDETCLFAVFNLVAGHVEAHELMHTMGAVQANSPNHSRFAHCLDDYDIMCYNDGSGGLRVVCSGRSNEMRLDCNHDDYFSTNPTRGGYLDTHWNTADSRWFESVRGTRSRPTEDPSP